MTKGTLTDSDKRPGEVCSIKFCSALFLFACLRLKSKSFLFLYILKRTHNSSLSLEMARLLFRLLGESNSPSPVQDPSTAAVTSDLVVTLAALLCAMVCVLGLLAVSRCVWLRRLAAGNRTHAGSQGGSVQSPPPPVAAANKGLKKKVLQSLPKLTFSPDSPSSEKFTECAICLTEFSNGDELRVLPQCGHGFHVSCIDTWLGSHSSCPSCRQILVVARCHKCGGLPGSSSSEPEIEIRIKQGADVPNSYLP